MSGYIGTQPVPQATQTRDSFTATSGQTSFATGGYTPNFLDVYLNGVKLASADYTATNGSDVVLASGAATGDILEVVAFTTFTPANIPSGTPSIDDNGNATAITIDSSESVLIGKTALGVANAGFAVRNFGTGSGGGTTIELAKDDATAMYLNRTSSDGEIVTIRKDNTTVGSIGSVSGVDLFVAGNRGAGQRYLLNNILPCNASGDVIDNTIDFGQSANRYKDAYLSGGVYLGGTGSANKLDDFEVGTWTPSVNVAITGTGSRVGKYTKVGRLVTATCSMTYTGLTGSTVAISNLPFTNGSVRQACVQGFFGGADSDSINGIVVESSDTRFYVYPAGSYSGATLTAHFSVAYQVD